MTAIIPALKFTARQKAIIMQVVVNVLDAMEGFWKGYKRGDWVHKITTE